MAKTKTGPKVKRKGGGVPAKSRAVDELAEQLSGATAVIVTEYRGLKVGSCRSSAAGYDRRASSTTS